MEVLLGCGVQRGKGIKETPVTWKQLSVVCCLWENVGSDRFRGEKGATHLLGPPLCCLFMGFSENKRGSLLTCT